MVAGPGIEPGTQGFSVLPLTVLNFSFKFTLLQYYLHLIAHGWLATLAKFKPGMEVSKHGCTIGEFLDQVKAASKTPLKLKRASVTLRSISELLRDAMIFPMPLAKPQQNIPVHPVNLPSWRRVRLAA
jgi:hypothetical protein